MADDNPIDSLIVKDQSTYQRDGSLKRERVYMFWLGKHGPFTERVPLDNFDPSEIDRRIQTLRLHLSALPR